jgi:hypothetical protein
VSRTREKCLAKARAAKTLLVMTNFESLAHTWLRLAEELERAEALLEQLKVPERKASQGRAPCLDLSVALLRSERLPGRGVLPPVGSLAGESQS